MKLSNCFDVAAKPRPAWQDASPVLAEDSAEQIDNSDGAEPEHALIFGDRLSPGKYRSQWTLGWRIYGPIGTG